MTIAQDFNVAHQFLLDVKHVGKLIELDQKEVLSQTIEVGIEALKREDQSDGDDQ